MLVINVSNSLDQAATHVQCIAKISVYSSQYFPLVVVVASRDLLGDNLSRNSAAG